MVGILIAFCANNIIWGIILVYAIYVVQNKALPKVLRPKVKKDDPESPENYEEATDDQIAKHFDNLAKTMQTQTGFDADGNKVTSKEERVVE